MRDDSVIVYFFVFSRAFKPVGERVKWKMAPGCSVIDDPGGKALIVQRNTIADYHASRSQAGKIDIASTGKDKAQ